MKAGQLLSFIVEALPETAQQALASLHRDAPPMSAELAARRGRATSSAPRPSGCSSTGRPGPVAAASVGQVHRAVTRDGRDVAVKVQYPGVGDAIEADLANAEALYRLFGAFALKGLDTKALVDELRVADARRARLPASRRRNHRPSSARTSPATRSSRIPSGRPEHEHAAGADHRVGRRAGVGRVRRARPTPRRAVAPARASGASRSTRSMRVGAFNGDPHPGNYRFSRDGDVTFLDFGLVKRWTAGEWQLLDPSIDAIVVHRDPERLVAAMEAVGFLRPGHGLDAAGGLRLRQRAVPARTSPTTFTFTRDVHARHACADHRRQGPARRGDRAAQHAGRASSSSTGSCGASSAILGKLERHRARGGRCCSSTARRAPPATPLGVAGAGLAGRTRDRLTPPVKIALGGPLGCTGDARQHRPMGEHRGRSVQAESTVRSVGPPRAAGPVRRRGVGAPRRQLQVGRDEAVRGARRLGRHRARARREDAPRHPLLQARLARRAVAQAPARAARDEPGPADQAGQRRRWCASSRR